MDSLRPFFSYFGSKYSLAKHYPQPRYEKIIEPFAGSAGYSLRYPRHDVLLYDTDPVVVGVWDYLIRSNSSDILRLSIDIQHIDDIKGCQEAKWLVGFWFGQSNSAPYTKPTTWMLSGTRPTSFWGKEIRNRIASNVRYIKHWRIHRKSYHTLDTKQEATWFVDPPYEESGIKYKYSSKGIDYLHLGNWCQKVQGQVMVCEMAGAKWLPFSPFKPNFSSSVKGGRKKIVYGMELLWTNDKDKE